MNHFYNSYFPNHNRAFHINNLQKGVEKNLLGVERVDFAERGRSIPKGVGVGRSATFYDKLNEKYSFYENNLTELNESFIINNKMCIMICLL